MAQWKPINLMDVIGMASNPVNPGTKYAKRLLNVYPHLKPGALTLRNGYAPKYTPPSNNTITNSSFISFGVFYDKQADPNGQEIICEIQRGIVNALTENDVPIVENTLQGFWFWVRPYWDGAQWVNNWEWVNKTIITKILVDDANYPSRIKIFGNLTHGLGDDSLIGWTIYNVTKNQFARIITCKIEDTGLWLNLSLYENEWEVDDVIICSKHWIDINAQLEFYSNVEKEDIVFHRINNDLRIGFGGYENRPGIAIGYRKHFRQIKEINFTQKDSAMLEDDVIEKYATIDGIILDTHIMVNTQYGIKLETSSGALDAGVHYFRLTGTMDNYEEQYVAQANIEVDGTQDINIQTYIIEGINNVKVNKLTLYHSTDNITFYKVREDVVTTDNLLQATFTLEENGNLESGSESFQGEGEYHKDQNAASLTNEINSEGQWLNLGYSNPAQGVSLASVTAFTHPVIGAISPADGSYFLYWQNPSSVAQQMKISSPPITTSKKSLSVSFKIVARYITVRVSSTGVTDPNGFPNPFGEEEDYRDIIINDLMDWEEHTIDLIINGSLTFEVIQGNVGGQRIGVDSLTIENPNAGTPEEGNEMALEMGYTPTFNLVKGWDQAIIRRGRVYYLNPFIEKRYSNYLVVSHISSSNSFMWDVATFDNFRELEKNDSNEVVAIELMANNEILILKDSSFTSLYEDGLVGIPREPIYGIGCISKSSVVNIAGLIIWCDKEEIYLLNIGGSFVPKAMLKDTIRDIYLAIEDKTKILGVRNRFNTYRIRVNDSEQKAEYLLTDTGWVEERKWHFAEIYRPGYNNKLYFLSSGFIYEEQVDYTLPAPVSNYGDETDE